MKTGSKQKVFNILRSMKPGDEFTGYGLADRLWNKYGGFRYPATCLRYMREYRELYGVDIDCIDNDKSLYRIIG